ncbi:MAG: hypothetical protein D6762_09255 [Candidatus Neomarinimicrobiota bacterium]|nr:MAG: hypothetical protein D6762_09255 [Candidatus Neomarinimicrobiota bacterium]
MNKSLLLVLWGMVSALWGQNSILNTKHNLSVSGPGTLTSTEETEVCIFCHASHQGSAAAPLWNRSANTTTYTMYGSPSMTSTSSQPGTVSRLCLSCHDGTVALGMVLNRVDPIAFPVGMDKIPPGYRSNLSDNLADDHPLHLSGHPNGAELNCTGCHDSHGGPGMTSRPLECTSCHDAHDDTWGHFLKVNPVQGGVCLLCHNKTNWTTSSHKTSNATWNGSGPDPWPYTDWTTTSDNACFNCHVPHGSSSQYWLLKSSAEEDNCLVCHNGNVAQNIQSDLMKASTHPVENYTAIHTPDEDPLTMVTHVECTDCHNPHQVNDGSGAAPAIRGSERGVPGLDKNGSPVQPAVNEYEICLKCHDHDLPSIPTYVPRRDNTGSIRLDFAETNASYHPVFGVGKNPDVPTLLSPWTENSIMYCTDCHSSDTGGTGSAPNGPHGSAYAPLLKKQLNFTDHQSENSSLYAACYDCHDRNMIVNKNGGSGFKEHRKHVVGEKAACTTCHDPHGSVNNTHLINFNTDYVSPNRDGELRWEDRGNHRGACYLKCHGEDHHPESY